MPYKCSKCGQEFQLKCRFRGHMRRRFSCVTQTSLDAFKRLASVTLRKFEDGYRSYEYFKNRIRDIDLFHNNLSDEEKAAADEIYKIDLAPVFEMLESIECEPRINTADSQCPVR